MRKQVRSSQRFDFGEKSSVLTLDEGENIGLPLYVEEAVSPTEPLPDPSEAASAVTSNTPDPNDIYSLNVLSTWSSGTPVTYGFGTSADQYLSIYEIITGIDIPYSNADEPDNMTALTDQGKTVFREAIALWGSVSQIDFVETAPDTDTNILIAGSSEPSTAWAYGPGLQPANGDIWVNVEATRGSSSTLLFDRLVNTTTAYVGSYEYMVALHEVGHSLGLKHPHDVSSNSTTLSLEFDSVEFTVMSYRSYVGDEVPGGYSVEYWGYPQSLMMIDIAAIQLLYGADYSAEAGDTVYRIDETTGEMTVDGVSLGMPGANRVLRTIWDGDGFDTLDLGNYTTDLLINLNAGAGSDLDVGGNSQRSILGRDAYDLDDDGTTNEWVYASNHLYMSLLYQDDTRSLIEAAYGGAGNDTLIGNEVANLLGGGLGIDTLTLGLGADTVTGTLAELDGDTITDFTNEDRIVVEGSLLSLDQIEIDNVSGQISVDEDGDGTQDMVLDLGVGIADATIALKTVNGTTEIAVRDETVIGLTTAQDIFVTNSTVSMSIFGNSGDDLIYSGSGDDRLYGGTGHDLLVGGDGDDTLMGGSSGDFYEGGAGADRYVFELADFAIGDTTELLRDFSVSEDILEFSGFAAQSMADIQLYDVQSIGVYGIVDNLATFYLEGVDLADLTAANFDFTEATSQIADAYEVTQYDLSDGDEQFEILGTSDDLIFAGGGYDFIDGGGGNDSLYGGDGHDLILGGDGDDIIVGGEGSDRLQGGNGADLFIFDFSDSVGSPDSVVDYITDFELGIDTVELAGFGLSSLSEMQVYAVGTSLVVFVNTTQLLVFDNVDPASMQLEPDLFQFV